MACSSESTGMLYLHVPVLVVFFMNANMTKDSDIIFLNSLTGLQIKAEAENEFYKKEAKDMVNIVQKLILDGK